MKTKLINYSICLFTTFIIGLIATLIVSLLTSLQVINNETSKNIMVGISFFLSMLLGFLIGYKEKRRGLLNGLLLSIIYLSIFFVMKTINANNMSTNAFIIIGRISLLIFGCILGVNLKH